MADSFLIETVIDSVRNTLRDATDAEIELTNSGVHRIVEDGKLCGFSDTGERTLIIRFVIPDNARSPEDAKLEFLRAQRTIKLVKPGDGYEEIPSAFGFSEFKLEQKA